MPNRIYNKSVWQGQWSFSYGPVVSARTYGGITLYPQDPCNCWQFFNGFGTGFTDAPGQTNQVANMYYFTDSTVANSNTFRTFRYIKVKIYYTVKNYTGSVVASGTLKGNPAGFNQYNTYNDLIMATVPVGYSSAATSIPDDDQWEASMDWKWKLVPQPDVFYTRVYNSNAVNDATVINPKNSTRRIVRTLRPWKIERTSRKNYMFDDDYETTLSGVGGTNSGITRKHGIDCIFFSPWYLNAQNTATIQCKVHIKMKIYGYWYKPRRQFSDS